MWSTNQRLLRRLWHRTFDGHKTNQMLSKYNRNFKFLCYRMKWHISSILYHISLYLSAFLGADHLCGRTVALLTTASTTWQTFKIERKQLSWRCRKCHNHCQKCGPELVKESIYNVHCTVTSGEADDVEWMRMRTQVQTNKWMRRFKLKMSLYWPLYQNTTKGFRKGTNKT